VRGGIDVSAAGIVPLTGEWEVLEDTSRPAAESLPEYDELPRAWDSPFGYAAYRIRVRGLDPHEDYALKLYYQATSFRVSIDGKEVFSGGTPGRTEEETRPFFLSGVAAVPAGVGTAELVLETANFSHRRGGPTRAILLGPASEIRRYEARATFKDAAAIILCLVMGCVFFLNAAVRRQASSLFLGLIYVFCGLMVFLVSAEMFVGRIFPRRVLAGRALPYRPAPRHPLRRRRRSPAVGLYARESATPAELHPARRGRARRLRTGRTEALSLREEPNGGLRRPFLHRREQHPLR